MGLSTAAEVFVADDWAVFRSSDVRLDPDRRRDISQVRRNELSIAPFNRQNAILDKMEAIFYGNF